MTHPCKGCVDSSRIPGTRQYVCDFLLHTGRARSLVCLPGAACTMKSTKPRPLEEIKAVTEDKIIFMGWQTVYVPIDGMGIDYNLYRRPPEGEEDT